MNKQAQAKIPIPEFFKKWQITGYPKNLLVNVYTGVEADHARRFLNSKLQAGRNKAPQTRPYGSKWPNKHPWKEIVNSLNDYDLRDAQKNMLKRVYIAVTAQNKKGRTEVRAPVNFNIKNMTLNQAVQKQKNVLRAARQAEQRRSRQAAQRNVFFNTKENIEEEPNNKPTYEQHLRNMGQF